MSKRILVVAPHPDDETLGAGGAIAKFVQEGHHVSILTVAGHRPPLYEESAYQRTVREAREAHRILGSTDAVFLDLAATTLGTIPIHELNRKIAIEFERASPDIVLCPYPDRHVDHRLIFDSVMVAARPVRPSAKIEILAAYETLSETHWNAPHIEPAFTPTWIIDITQHIEQKLAALACYKSQIPPFPGSRSLEAARALAVFRGTQAGFAYGEGFHVIRMLT